MSNTNELLKELAEKLENMTQEEFDALVKPYLDTIDSTSPYQYADLERFINDLGKWADKVKEGKADPSDY